MRAIVPELPFMYGMVTLVMGVLFCLESFGSLQVLRLILCSSRSL